MMFTGPGFRPKDERNAPSRAEDLADFAVSYRGPRERFQEMEMGGCWKGLEMYGESGHWCE